MKKCNVCKEVRDLANYTKDRRQKDGLDRRCKHCKAKIYGKINKDERKEYRRNRYERYKSLETTKVSAYRQKHQEWWTEYSKKYAQENLGKCAAKTAKYRASRLKATPAWLTDEQLKDIERIYETCPKGYEVDHIIPLQGKEVSGLHVAWNLRHLPARLNKRKSNRLDHQECLTPAA